jgi:hypothetical protein
MDLDSGHAAAGARLGWSILPAVCRARLAVMLAVAVASGGCFVVTLSPAYDDQSIVFDDALIGRWDNAEDRTSVVIDRAEWRSYKLTYTDRSTTYAFQGNLTTIDGEQFLDLTRPRGSDAGPLLMQVHAVYRVRRGADRLTAAAIDYGWVTRAMNEKRLGRLLAAIDDRRNAVIAARTEDLRAWLAKAPPDAFAAAMTFKRTDAQ